jgi:RecA/RadA recombinase
MAPSKEVRAGATRGLSATQRREKFLAAQAKAKPDWRTVEIEAESTFYPYGNLTLDSVLGLKGTVHGGRVVHIHGNEHAGKSTLSVDILGKYQQLTAEPVCYLDFEGTLIAEYFNKLIYDPKMAALKIPTGIQDGSNIMLHMMSQGVRYFVCDSIPRMNMAFTAKEILEGKAYKPTMGKHAKAISDFYTAMLPHFIENDCTVIMINQQRDRMDDEGAMAVKYPSFTNLPYVLPGGRANRYYSSVMLELKTKKAYRAGGFKDDPFIIEPGKNEGNFVATEVRARSIKNKVTGGGYREGKIWHRPGQGLDENITIRQLAREFGFIGYKGTWFAGETPDTAFKTYNNKEEAIQDLVIDQNPEVLDQLRTLLATAIEQNGDQFKTTLSQDEATYLKGEDSGQNDEDDVDVATANFVIGDDELEGIGDE